MRGGANKRTLYISHISHCFNNLILDLIFFFFGIKNEGVYDYIKPPGRVHTLRDVMPTNGLLLVAGIEPERVRQSE